MDQELYSALKKGKPHTVEKLIQEHLARSWFLCQETAMDSAMAVPLLLSSWERALAACRGGHPAGRRLRQRGQRRHGRLRRVLPRRYGLQRLRLQQF